MKTFKIAVTRTMYDSIIVDIDAETMEEAEDFARENAESGEYDSLWEDGCSDIEFSTEAT